MYERNYWEKDLSFNKGLRIYGGVYHPPFDTLKIGNSTDDLKLKLYRQYDWHFIENMTFIVCRKETSMTFPYGVL